MALSLARKSVEAVALHLYAREVGDPDAAPKRLMLDDLLKALVKHKQIPDGVAMHFGTVQRYGNYGAHPQADDASVGNTVAFNQPCIESLRFIARWYFKDRLRLSEAELSDTMREVVYRVPSAGPAPTDPTPTPAPTPTPTPSVVPSVAPPRERSDIDRFGLEGHCLEGKYEVERAVAEGGFGVVYRGRHTTLEKAIAVKVLKTPPDTPPSARASFADGFALEAKTIARLEHAAIVKVIDFGVSAMPTGERAPWMVLDWVQGETLEALLKRRRGAGGWAPRECLGLLRPVILALAHAHELGIAHRDVKPANVILTAGPEAPGDGSFQGRASVAPSGRRRDAGVKLLDFGIAKVMRAEESAGSGQTQTQAQFTAFSLRYAAPEQVSGTRTGPWTDVHAIALLLVEMLVGESPYRGGDTQDLYVAVLSPQRPTPAALGVDVGAWEPVLAKALAARPAERYANAGELLDALEAEVPAAATRAAGPSAEREPGPSTERGPGPETLRGAEVSRVEPVRSGARLRQVAAALAVAVVVGVGAFAVLHGREPVANARPAATPVTRIAAPTPTVVNPVAAQVPAPSVAPPPAAPDAGVVEAAPPSPAVAVANAPDEEEHGGRHSRRHGRRERRSRHGAAAAQGGGSAPAVTANTAVEVQ